MSSKRNKIIFYASTGLLSALMLFSAGMYFFNHDMVVEMFTSLGYPPYIIYPLGIAKILGVIAIWVRKSPALTEWAYAGFFFDIVLALTAHLMVQDGAHGTAVVALILFTASYLSGKRLNL